MFGSCPTRLTRSCSTLTRTRCGLGDIVGRSARVFKFIFDRHNHTRPSAKPRKTLTRPCRNLQPMGAKGIDGVGTGDLAEAPPQKWRILDDAARAVPGLEQG